ncbi:hypothetical protein [Kitasatospora sp. NPDC059327]|uniref:hypothetical protein n=1 Tax=Kitasatospora sp. NPDC059327 TaxID=3346803 RepID=UPI003682A5F6
MLAIAVRTENDERHPLVTAEALASLIRGIGGRRDRFVVMERVPDVPDFYIQVWHEAGGTYTLEHRAGSAEHHFQVRLDGPEPVIAAMTGWARLQDGWDAGLEWEPVDLAAESGK